MSVGQVPHGLAGTAGMLGRLLGQRRQIRDTLLGKVLLDAHEPSLPGLLPIIRTAHPFHENPPWHRVPRAGRLQRDSREGRLCNGHEEFLVSVRHRHPDRHARIAYESMLSRHSVCRAAMMPNSV